MFARRNGVRHRDAQLTKTRRADGDEEGRGSFNAGSQIVEALFDQIVSRKVGSHRARHFSQRSNHSSAARSAAGVT